MLENETEVTPIEGVADENEMVTVTVTEEPAKKAPRKSRAKKVEPVAEEEPTSEDFEGVEGPADRPAPEAADEAPTEFATIYEWAQSKKWISDPRMIPVEGPKPKAAKKPVASSEWFAAKKVLYGAVKKHSRSRSGARGKPGWQWVDEGTNGFAPDELFSIIVRAKTPEGAINAAQRAIDKKLALLVEAAPIEEPTTEVAEVAAEALSEAS